MRRSEVDGSSDSDGSDSDELLRPQPLSEFAFLDGKKRAVEEDASASQMRTVGGAENSGRGSSAECSGDDGSASKAPVPSLKPGVGFRVKPGLGLNLGGIGRDTLRGHVTDAPATARGAPGASGEAGVSEGSSDDDEDGSDDHDDHDDAVCPPASGAPAAGSPPVPKLTLGGTGVQSRKPPGLGLSLGGLGQVESNSAAPSSTGTASPGSPPRPAGRPVLGRLSQGNRPLGLDLEALRDNTDQPLSELQIRREKFAFFEKHCTKIVDGIYVAGEGVARNRATLDEHNITHVVNCNAFIIPNYFEPDLTYKALWLQDTPNEDITCVLYDCFDFIRDALNSGGRVLVHCSQGVSRSASVVISFLMWRDGDNYENTFRLVKEKRGIANPNMGFTCQMLQWSKRLKAEGNPGGAVHRLHRIAPHSPHDPRYLVAKPMGSHSADQLDSRGAFVLQTANGKVYVWVGPAVEDQEYIRRGERFARQLCEYEGLGSGGGDEVGTIAKVAIIRGGEEPSEMLQVLGVTPTEDGSCEGGNAVDGRRGWVGAAEARVAAYDADFALYTKGERSSSAIESGAAVPAPAWARALTSGGSGASSSHGTGQGKKPVLKKLNSSPAARSTPPTPTGPQSFPVLDSDMSSSDVSSLATSPTPPALGRSNSLPSESSRDLDLEGESAQPKSPLGRSPPVNMTSPQSRPLMTDDDDSSDDELSQGDVADISEEPRMRKQRRMSKGSDDCAPITVSGLSFSSLGLGGGERGGVEHGSAVVAMHESVSEDCSQQGGGAFSRPRPPSKPPHMPLRPNVMVRIPPLQRSGNGFETGAAPATARPGGSISAAEDSPTSVGRDDRERDLSAPILYDYPALEPMGMFDVDDLDPGCVFVLCVPQTKDCGGGSAIYVWIGGDAGDKLELGDNLDKAGGRIGEECVMKLGVQDVHGVHVEMEGSESTAFWEAFEEGL